MERTETLRNDIVIRLFDKFIEAKSLLTGAKCYIPRLPLSELSEPQELMF